MAAIALVIGISAPAADKVSPDKAVGATASRPPAPLDTRAMNAMLRADRDKDGVLSPQELEQFDASLARRFREADSDRDGKLTLHEFEKLFSPPETSASRNTLIDQTNPPGIPRGVGATR
jgi:hypothetical protein